MKKLFDKLTDPFPVAIGAITVTAGIIIGAPWLIAGGVAVWLGAGAVEYLQKPKGADLPKLEWFRWTEQTKTMPEDIGALIRDIIQEGKGIDEMAGHVNIGAEVVQTDLIEVMVDVMEIGRQADLLHRHLQSWNLPQLRRRLAASSGEAETALSEQITIIESLLDKYRNFYQELSTLQAQMGAVRANLLQTSLQKEMPASVKGELAQLRDTAHSIAEGYALVTDGLPESVSANG